MGEAIGQSAPLALGVALSPVPIIAIALILGTPRAAANGPAFVLGWVVGLTAVGTLLLLASGGEQGESASWVSWVELGLAVALIAVAAKSWRARPRGEPDEASLPAWMSRIDSFTPVRSAAAGVLLSVANPKNLILMLGAVAAIVDTDASSGQQAAALAVFVAIGALGAALPVALYFAMGERAQKPLDRLRRWMVHNSALIVALICLAIAAKLIADAIAGFS